MDNLTCVVPPQARVSHYYLLTDHPRESSRQAVGLRDKLLDFVISCGFRDNKLVASRGLCGSLKNQDKIKKVIERK